MADPPTKQMSWLCMKDGAQPPTPSRRRRPPGRPAWTTQQASIPTWGQIKSLCHQAQGIASLQGSSASPERVFIAMLALLSCQASATSSTSEKYWAYFPGPLTFQVVTWNSDPIRVNTDQPHLLGGSYSSYDKDHYPINFNYTFRGLTDDLPLCFNFPHSHTSDLITPSKEGRVGASKTILTDSPASKFSDNTGDRLVWILQAHMPGVLDPYKSLFLNAPPKYPNCIDVAPSDVIWKTIDNRLGYPVWKSCTYNSNIDYRIPGGGNYSVQDWSNPNPSQNLGAVSRLSN